MNDIDFDGAMKKLTNFIKSDSVPYAGLVALSRTALNVAKAKAIWDGHDFEDDEEQDDDETTI